MNGVLPKVGQHAPAFKLAGKSLNDVTLADFAGKKKILNVVPSLDTGVCSLSAKKFNQKGTILACFIDGTRFDLSLTHRVVLLVVVVGLQWRS